MKYDLTEVDKLFKELGYERYLKHTGNPISYRKVRNYYKGDYKIITETWVGVLYNDLVLVGYYYRDGEARNATSVCIEPELYKAIGLLLKTVGMI